LPKPRFCKPDSIRADKSGIYVNIYIKNVIFFLPKGYAVVIIKKVDLWSDNIDDKKILQMRRNNTLFVWENLKNECEKQRFHIN
jgi:hypothetical protein